MSLAQRTLFPTLTWKLSDLATEIFHQCRSDVDVVSDSCVLPRHLEDCARSFDSFRPPRELHVLNVRLLEEWGCHTDTQIVQSWPWQKYGSRPEYKTHIRKHWGWNLLVYSRNNAPALVILLGLMWVVCKCRALSRASCDSENSRKISYSFLKNAARRCHV